MAQKYFSSEKNSIPSPDCDQSPIFKTKAVCCLPHGHILAHLSGQKCPQLTHVDFNKWLDPSLSPRSDVSSPDVKQRASICHEQSTPTNVLSQPYNYNMNIF